MIALAIVGGIALLVLLVLLIPVGIEIRYDGEIALTLRAAFIRYRLIPKRKKKINLRKFSKKRFEKMLEKERRREEKKARKKAKRKTEHEGGEKKPKDTGEKKGLVSDLWRLRSLIAKTVARFIHSIRTNVVRIHLKIGADDAASCALLYGAASQFTAYTLELLRTQTKMKGGEDVAVAANFTSEKTEADVEVRFSIRVANALAAGIRFLFGYIKYKAKEK